LIGGRGIVMDYPGVPSSVIIFICFCFIVPTDRGA